MSYTGHSLGVVLPLGRDTVSVFYWPGRLGCYKLDPYMYYQLAMTAASLSVKYSQRCSFSTGPIRLDEQIKTFISSLVDTCRYASDLSLYPMHRLLQRSAGGILLSAGTNLNKILLLSRPTQFYPTVAQQ